MQVGNSGFKPGGWTAASILGTVADTAIESCRLGIGESFQQGASGVEIGAAVVHGIATLAAGIGTVGEASKNDGNVGYGLIGTTGELAKTTGYILQSVGMNPLIGFACIATGSVLSIVGAAGTDS